MKTYIDSIYKNHIICRITLCMMFLAAYTSAALALPTDHYAASSMLSTGRWQRVTVGSEGMHFISNSDLKSMGFADPSKVNVYGYGGRMEAEALTTDMGDDLPLMPSVHTSKGLVFFATDHNSWKLSPADGMLYEHTVNPYSEASCYFLSDRDKPDAETPRSDTSAGKGQRAVREFTSRLVHEREMVAPSETGRTLLGEDFRSATRQTFSFNLPGNIGDEVYARVMFGANISNGSASLLFTANGEKLSSTDTDRVPGVTSSQFVRYASTVKTIPDAGKSLALGIECSYTGAIQSARLDYIEVEYTRELQLEGGEIYFYGTFSDGDYAEVSGCSASTVIWDVTNHTRPTLVAFELEGDKAVFKARGYKEFVAFEPEKITRKITAHSTVSNQDIHGMEIPDMVIISPEMYRQGAERIAKLHRSVDGFTVHVLDPQSVYNEFSSGTADVSAFRKLLKMWHDRGEGKLRYCLMMGRPSYDNKMVTQKLKSAGYAILPIWQSKDGVTESTSYSTDDYIGMLEDCTEESFDISRAKMQVAVGRLPVTSASEADRMAQKIERYVTKPNYGTWRNNVMIIADDQDNGEHLNQAESAYNLYRSNGNGRHFLYDRLYLDSYPLSYTGTGAAYPEARERMIRNFNESLYIHYIGHAATTSWSHEGILTWNDIISVSNTNLPFLYGATCSFGQWDADNVSGGESMVLNPTSGMIGMIVPSRTVYISLNGELGNRMANAVFKKSADGRGQRAGDIFIEGKNATPGSDTNKLRYCLIADPALSIANATHGVEVTRIAGVDNVSAATEPPVVSALQNFEVEGIITNPDGTRAADFNGVVCITLYDAERSIETYGNGSEGVQSIYNDRKNLLYKGRAKVENGSWKCQVLMPADIDNNYSPALINCYAYSEESGLEANGSTENLYVYGYADMEIDDADGPLIENFYLNTPHFTEGCLVNSTPVVYAKVSDPSGINISSSSIGHQLTLRVDDGELMTNVSDYFTPDSSEPGCGTIVYPMAELKPGEHTLKLTAWDNMGNSSFSTLSFNVGVTNAPTLYDLSPDVNPASTAVVFSIHTDRPMTKLECTIDIFDLNGRKVWSSTGTENSGLDSKLSSAWDLRDFSGTRVPRGIYLYRATVTTPEGTFATKTKKLAVTAQ